MLIFTYDQTFEGLLTVIFEAFRRREFPDGLMGLDEAWPLLAERRVEIVTHQEKARRVWAGLEKKLSPLAIKEILAAWLTEDSQDAELVVRYVRAIYGGVRETDFSHPDVLGLRQAAFKISREKEHMRQFVRFQKTTEGVYFAAVNPRYNVVPLVLHHFADRFADQKWVIYDINRHHGFYYNLESIEEISYFKPVDQQTGQLHQGDLAEGEAIIQQAWQAYFSSVAISERANPELQRQYMPKRFWAYLTEMKI